MATPTFYNSAVNNGTLRLPDLQPLERYDHARGTALRWNVLTEPMPPEYAACDVFYCEPPFPAGLKVFDGRAKQDSGAYSAFALGFSAMWSGIDRPKMAITSKPLLKYLPTPDRITTVRLNGASVLLASWKVIIPENLTNLQVCAYLGKNYRHIGDMTCGYGGPVMSFLSARDTNRFTVSDYDPHCVDAVQRMLSTL